ncbi:PH domain-containing protein [Xenorhabdus bovienii]|uniref:PH domain-containing protein n=1 Tax=Xenorhabdus bovienii TaxID=40576 RepID=UPI001EDCA9F0|nr:PH domain-containing protein [Xenorhabdus bovienii]MCG3462639.1 PH domain-containing protein [Xenorhabdus bovienii]
MINYKNADKKQLKNEFIRLSEKVSYKPTIGISDIFNHLPPVLNPDEVPLAVSSAVMGMKAWIVVITDFRIILLHKSTALFSKKIETSSINYENITSIDSSSNLAGGTITISTPGTIYEIKKLQKDTVQPLVNIISTAKADLSSSKERKVETQQNISADNDIINKLERLAELKEKGILTEDEFQSQKLKLLSK